MVYYYLQYSVTNLLTEPIKVLLYLVYMSTMMLRLNAFTHRD